MEQNQSESKPKEQHVCTDCLLGEGFPDISFDEHGRCNYCNDFTQRGYETSPLAAMGHLSEELQSQLLNCQSKEEFDALVAPGKGFDTSYFLHRIARGPKGEGLLRILKQDWEKTVDEVRGSPGYDCIVALSGGKDSTHLVYHLKEELGLNVLTYSVKIPFMTDIAWKNIDQTINKLDLSHITIHPPEDELYIQMYRDLLTRDSYPDGYMHAICYVCGPLFQNIGMREAASRGIPLVLMGYAPAQPDHIFYEQPQSAVNESQVPKEFDRRPFTDFMWNPADFPNSKFRVIAPYHVMDYDVGGIRQKIHSLGLVFESDPWKTNCDLCMLMFELNYQNLGWHELVDEFSTVIRRGGMKREWMLQGFKSMEEELAQGVFRKEEIGAVLDKLGLPLEQLLWKGKKK